MPPTPDERVSVLLAPADHNLESGGYARTYNLLARLAGSDIDLDVSVGHVREGAAVDADNVHIDETSVDSPVRYEAACYRRAWRALGSGSVDVYQHAFLHHPSFNPVLAFGPGSEVPVVVGPIEAGHEVCPDAFSWFAGSLLGLDPPDALPRWLTDALYGPAMAASDLALPVREWLFGRTLRAADRVVAVSTDTRDMLTEFVPRERTEVIPYGVDRSRFTYTERGDGTDLLTVGNLVRRKGHADLLDALVEVRKAVPSTHLHVVGTGPYGDALREHTRDRGLADAVTFHGRVSEGNLQELFAEARAFVHPSHSEGFSHVRLEAMASGCPVVGTDVSAAQDMTRDGVEGFVVPVGDVDALADAVLEVLTDADLAREMGRRARERVEQRFDWDVVAERYRELYVELGG